jgi:hypothetical protein
MVKSKRKAPHPHILEELFWKIDRQTGAPSSYLLPKCSQASAMQQVSDQSRNPIN